MNVTRATGTTGGNGNNGAFPNGTSDRANESMPSLTLSSERFNFSAFAEENIECIDKVGSLFKEFKKRPPTLKEALESMDYGEKTEELHKIFTDKAKEKFEEIEAPGLNVEDVATIFCYTYEWDEEKFGEGIDSPYRKLNKSMSAERNSSVLRKTRAFLFLLLRALRKLPRYIPVNRTLYRGIRTHVQTKKDLTRSDTKPYAKGNEKTWWTFTSASEDLEVTWLFVSKNSENNKGTLFTLSGEAWGYDISVFSNFPNEKEILLEPERRLRIKSVKKEGTIISVSAKILDTPLVLKDYIKVKVVKIKEKKSKSKGVPRNLRVELVMESTVTLLWDAPEIGGDKVLAYQISARQTSKAFFNRNPESTYIVRKGETKEEEPKDIVRGLEEKNDETKYTVRGLEEGKEYEFRVRCMYKDGWGREWSEKEVVKVVPFSKNEWMKCPDYVDKYSKYSVDEENPIIATKVNGNGCCTIIGSTPIPLGTVASWNIKVLQSKYNNGYGIYIGVATNDINQNDNNTNKCGWYFGCCWSWLCSGPPHNYDGKEYGPRKEKGEYVRTGDSVGVVMDTIKGELSFVLSNVNLGAAYEGIPLDKPLVPCVLLDNGSDSVELDLSEVKEEVDSSIPVPSVNTVKSITWDSATFIWDNISDVSFYQIEVNESKSWDVSTTNTFTKRGLLPNTEHSFRMRAVRGDSVSEWSDTIKERTLKAPEFSGCVWKECPDDVDEKKKYKVDEENPRIATNISDDNCNYCTIIGNTPIPPNTITSWSIKILKSQQNNGSNILIGIAPSDINQNSDCKYNFNIYGWYFYCYNLTLYSGPPRNYKGKEYISRKEDYGEHAHTGDSVGVVVDTTKGELSFILNKIDHGVAYKGIPLDKPLVPCVVLLYKNDSVQLVI